MYRPWPITFGNKESLSTRYVPKHWTFVAADEGESESLLLCVVGDSARHLTSEIEQASVRRVIGKPIAYMFTGLVDGTKVCARNG